MCNQCEKLRIENERLKSRGIEDLRWENDELKAKLAEVEASLTREREAARVMREALEKLKGHPCDHVYSPECKGCGYDRICNEALAKADEIRGNE